MLVEELSQARDQNLLMLAWGNVKFGYLGRELGHQNFALGEEQIAYVNAATVKEMLPHITKGKIDTSRVNLFNWPQLLGLEGVSQV